MNGGVSLDLTFKEHAQLITLDVFDDVTLEKVGEGYFVLTMDGHYKPILGDMRGNPLPDKWYKLQHKEHHFFVMSYWRH